MFLIYIYICNCERISYLNVFLVFWDVFIWKLFCMDLFILHGCLHVFFHLNGIFKINQGVPQPPLYFEPLLCWATFTWHPFTNYFFVKLNEKIPLPSSEVPPNKFPKVKAFIHLHTNLLILSSLSSLPIYLWSREYSNCKEVLMIEERDYTRKTI